VRDKDSLIPRPMAQDRKSAVELDMGSDAFEAGDPDDKNWDWDFEYGESTVRQHDEIADIDGTEDGGGTWEVVGEKKGKQKKGGSGTRGCGHA
jgi:hypothetical protein